jgi:hypothetical protein
MSSRQENQVREKKEKSAPRAKKGKKAAMAGAPDKNDKEIERLLKILEQEIADHTYTEKANSAQAAMRMETYTKVPFKTSLEIGTLPTIGAFEGRKMFKVATHNGDQIHASTIDNGLKEMLTDKKRTSRCVLFVQEGRNEILALLSRSQVESFETLGLKRPDKEMDELFDARSEEDEVDVDDI